MEELKPCPFCGGEAEIVEESQGHVMPYHVVECKTCFCNTGWCDSEAEAISTWNRRAAPGNNPLTLPNVTERDRQSIYDFLHDCFADWVNDPDVGLIGMNEGESALANAIMEALNFHKPEGEPK